MLTIIVKDDKIIYCPTSVILRMRVTLNEGKNKERILLFLKNGSSKIMNVLGTYH